MSNRSSRYPLEDIQNKQSKSEGDHDDQVNYLRSLLHRFTKIQLLSSVLDVCNLSDSFSGFRHGRRLDKKQVVDCIVKLVQEAELDLTDIACALELKYCQYHKSARQWNAILIKDAESYVQESTVVSKFDKKLSKYLNRSHLFCKVKSEFYDGALWSMVLMSHKGSRQHKAFILMYPKLAVVVHSNFKVTQKDVIIRCVVQLFRGVGHDVLPMRTKNIETLLLYSSEHFHLKVSDDREIPRQQRKTDDVEEERLPPNVVNEDAHEDMERNVYLLDTFGSYQELPLELLSYKVDAQFESLYHDSSLTCRAIFKGENVLEGIHSFVRMRAATYPLPDVITHAGTKEYGNKLIVNAKRLRTT